METLAATLESNPRAWKNIPSTIQCCFQDIAKVVKEQAQKIQTLQHQLATLQDEMTDLRSTTSGLEERILAQMKAEIGNAVQNIVDIQIKTMSNELEDRFIVLRTEMEQLRVQNTECIRKIEEVFQDQRDAAMKEMTGTWQNFMHECSEMQIQLKQDWQALSLAKEDLRTELLAETHEQIEKFEASRSSNNDVPHLVKQIDPESGLESIQEAVDKMTQEIQTTETRLTKQMFAWRQELATIIGKTPSKSEISKLLSRKVDTLEIWKQLAEKADVSKVDEITSKLMDTIQKAQETTMEDLEQMRQISNTKADTFEISQLKHNIHDVLSIVESLQQDLSVVRGELNQKLTVIDAKQLLDSEITLTGLQSAMKQIEKTVQGEFATKPELDSVVQQLRGMKRQLRGEIFQARYIWKDGRPSLKQTILWNTQVVNTNASIFVWKTGSDEVMLMIPGLYHLQIAFFTNFSPTIQVLVNGEPSLILSGDGISLGESLSGKLQRVHHSAGNVAGLTIDTFLALPSRAIVSVSYDIDEKAQGFLNLRKL